MAKNLVLGLIFAHLAKIWASNFFFFFFFFKNLIASVTRYYGQLLPCILSEKTNEAILRKLNNGLTDDRRGKSDFIGCCPTNIECPIETREQGRKYVQG